MVIFDCDGVLFDSKKANTEFYNYILSHFGREKMTEDQIEFVHKNTSQESLRYLFKNDRVLGDALQYRKTLDYSPFIQYMITEPHLFDLLEWLKPKMKTTISTNRSDTIGDVLRIKGLTEYFDLVISSLDVVNPKPHPESLFRIVEYFHISPSEAIFIGDSEIDELASTKAHIPFVAYKNQALSAKYHIDSLLEIREIVGESVR